MITGAEIAATFQTLGIATEEERQALRFEEFDADEGFAVQVFVGANTTDFPDSGENTPSA